MTLEEFMKVIKALGLDTSMTLEAAMAKIKGEGGADPDAGTEDAPPPAGDGGADEGAEGAPPTDPPEKSAEVAAASARLMRITEKSTYSDAVNEVEIWRASHVKLEAETAKLAKERQALELGKRKENAIALTKLGAETPFTTGLGGKDKKLCKRLLDEPLDEQTARVAALLAARGGKMPNAAPVPPVVDGAGGDLGLTPQELKKCAARKLDPAVYAKTKADIAARNAPRAQEG